MGRHLAVVAEDRALETGIRQDRDRIGPGAADDHLVAVDGDERDGARRHSTGLAGAQRDRVPQALRVAEAARRLQDAHQRRGRRRRRRREEGKAGAIAERHGAAPAGGDRIAAEAADQDAVAMPGQQAVLAALVGIERGKAGHHAGGGVARDLHIVAGDDGGGAEAVDAQDVAAQAAGHYRPAEIVRAVAVVADAQVVGAGGRAGDVERLEIDEVGGSALAHEAQLGIVARSHAEQRQRRGDQQPV